MTATALYAACEFEMTEAQHHYTGQHVFISDAIASIHPHYAFEANPVARILEIASEYT